MVEEREGNLLRFDFLKLIVVVCFLRFGFFGVVVLVFVVVLLLKFGIVFSVFV